MKTSKMYLSNLVPMFENKKSYYGKARIETYVRDEDVVRVLVSYETRVMRIEDGKLYRNPYQPCSATTLRHMREFAQQEGFGYMTKSQMLELPTF